VGCHALRGDLDEIIVDKSCSMKRAGRLFWGALLVLLVFIALVLLRV
jgi:hypothetical protein